MQMARHVLAAFFMPVHCEYFEGIDILRHGARRLYARLLAHLAQRDGQQVTLTVGVPARPRP